MPLSEEEVKILGTTIVKSEQGIVKALVYAARAQGIPAGVKPFSEDQDRIIGTPVDLDGKYERSVFIEYPERAIGWAYPEIYADYLDSLPLFPSEE